MTDLYLSTESELAALCETAKATGRLALDTEFHRERRYFPQLALLQLAAGDTRVLLDPLLGLDLSCLGAVLADSTVVKVLHSPAQDLEIFYFRFGQTSRNVFDTQTAAALLGLGAQISLGGLVERALGLRLEKGQSFTDWLRRPLTRKQERYALEDVAHLFSLHDWLGARLAALGRSEWLREECRRFEDASLYDPAPEGLYRKVKRYRSLDARGLAVLRELARWRDEIARQSDCNRRAVIGDEVLVELSRSKPQSLDRLSRTRGLHAKIVDKHGDAILASIREGKLVPNEDCPRAAGKRPVNEASELPATLAYAFLKVCAREAEIDVSMLANVSEVEKLVSDYFETHLDERAFPLLSGWRAELAGNRLMAFLRGEIAVRLHPDTGSPSFEAA